MERWVGDSNPRPRDRKTGTAKHKISVNFYEINHQLDCGDSLVDVFLFAFHEII